MRNGDSSDEGSAAEDLNLTQDVSKNDQQKTITGPDGLSYTPHTKIQSGLRPVQADDAELLRQSLKEMLENVHEEHPTVPDLCVLNGLAKEYEVLRRDFFECLPGVLFAEPSDLVANIEGQILQELAKLSESKYKKPPSVLPTAGKDLSILGKTSHFKYPWWQSTNPLVRLWGQLNCACQLLDDIQMVKDLAEVLGKEFVHLDRVTHTDGQVNFVSVIRNMQFIRQAVLDKYPDHEDLFDAIIATEDKK